MLYHANMVEHMVSTQTIAASGRQMSFNIMHRHMRIWRTSAYDFERSLGRRWCEVGTSLLKIFIMLTGNNFLSLILKDLAMILELHFLSYIFQI